MFNIESTTLAALRALRREEGVEWGYILSDSFDTAEFYFVFVFFYSVDWEMDRFFMATGRFNLSGVLFGGRRATSFSLIKRWQRCER